MHNVFFLLIALGIVLVGLLGIGVYKLINRPRSDEGIHEFRSARETLALFHHRHHNKQHVSVGSRKRRR
ncbi:MAG: hypothetical protein GY708_12845 [Actinomycetia bacterium]|nr:hypothetical protein [Actinomycetes bacterium]MCP4961551.1 hypothetical protein [Actinomycetes bacterium]